MAKDNDAKDDKDPQTVNIYVNTKPHTVPKGDISFETVTTLAFPTTPSGGNVGYTVTWQRGHGSKDGTLVAGQSVAVKDGMIFDVTSTHLS
jgi:hypothetical protein